jgi:A/G-specific adenine glycosylase
MLQQTTVAAVKPYFAAFLARWPTVAELAAAPVDDVMRAWAGLGYYSRARNLHSCAQTVVHDLGGTFPETEAGLRALPGVGPYTAAAIAAIAFDQRAVVVDGNVERVMARFFAVEEALPAAKPRLRALAATLTPGSRPGDYAQAVMDLGATICTPRRPACGLCPLMSGCTARLTAPETFPRKGAKPERPLRRGAAFFLRRGDGAVLVRTRPPKGLLGGMTEIPGSAWSDSYDAATCVGEAPLAVPYRRLPDKVEHGFTHFELHLDLFVGDVANGTAAPADCRWVAAESLDAEALPSLMRKVVAAARASSWWQA